MSPPRTFLIITQAYVPDPASVGQHVADVSAEMVRRGYRVVVYTSARGYEDPSKIYPTREFRDGVEIRRLSLSSFGKSSLAVRLVAQWIFLIQATIRGLFLRHLCGVMTSTMPPFCGIAGALISKARRVPFKYWLMDLNPDQVIAMRVLSPDSWLVRAFDALNRVTLRTASDVVVLDRFMEDRVSRKLDGVSAKLEIIPPWAHEDTPGNLEHHDNAFRRAHVPEGKFVVMYSGNHTPANPISTLLMATIRLKHEQRLMLLSVGGGSGKQEVERMIASGASNIVSLPYQPFESLRYSLSAADVHVVSIGDGVVGIVHPCKVYGAMAASRPILLLGPVPNHVSDLIDRHKIGWHVEHGDVDGAERVLKSMLTMAREELNAMGARAASVIDSLLSKRRLVGRLCDVLERGVAS